MNASRWSLLFLLAMVAAACTSGKDDAGGGGVLTSDMSGAVSLALSKPAADSPSFAFGETGTVDTSGEPFFSLVKIDGNGNVDAVFNQQRPIHWVEVNDTHVAVSGIFNDILAQVDDGETPEAVNCRLVTFPRTATGEAVKCISRGVGFPNNDPLLTEGVPTDYPGFTARGTAVYFTELIQPNPEEGTTTVWKWEGGSDVVESLLQFDLPLAMVQTFAMDGGNHLCAMSLAGGHPNGSESLYCTPLATSSWQVVPNDPSGFANARALVLGSNLLTGYSRVSLVDGTVVSTAAGPLPTGRDHTILVGDTAWGLAIGIGSPGGDLVRATATGGGIVDSSVDWERMAGAGDAAYVYGAGQLKRLEFATATLGSSNLLGSTTLLQVTDMSLSTDGNIRLDGTTSAGVPAIVLVDTITGEVQVTNEDVPTFQTVTPLQ